MQCQAYMETSGAQSSASWLGTQGGAFQLDEDSLFRRALLARVSPDTMPSAALAVTPPQPCPGGHSEPHQCQGAHHVRAAGSASARAAASWGAEAGAPAACRMVLAPFGVGLRHSKRVGRSLGAADHTRLFVPEVHVVMSSHDFQVLNDIIELTGTAPARLPGCDPGWQAWPWAAAGRAARSCLECDCRPHRAPAAGAGRLTGLAMHAHGAQAPALSSESMPQVHSL